MIEFEPKMYCLVIETFLYLFDFYHLQCSKICTYDTISDRITIVCKEIAGSSIVQYSIDHQNNSKTSTVYYKCSCRVRFNLKNPEETSLLEQ